MRRLVWLAALALGIAANASAQAERLSDKDVKDLMEAIDKGRDHFVDALDPQFKHAVMRSPTNEVDVSKYLDDFDKNIHTMKDRFKGDYAASAEVQTVLRQASDIDAYVRQQGAMKGDERMGRARRAVRRAREGVRHALPQSARTRPCGAWATKKRRRPPT